MIILRNNPICIFLPIHYHFYCNLQYFIINIVIYKQQKISTLMKSPKLKKSLKLNSLDVSKMMFQNQQSASQSVQFKPWNENKIGRITASLPSKQIKSIFSLSKRSQSNKIKGKQTKVLNCSMRSYKSKPKTAPHNVDNRNNRYQTRHNKKFLSQQLSKMGAVSTEQIIDENFEENLESINFYPQFRASIQQKRNLLYLKPYVKTNYDSKKETNEKHSFDTIQKLKSELYRGIFESEQLFTLPEQPDKNFKNIKQNEPYNSLNSNRTVIQYMTQYEGDHFVEGKKSTNESKQRHNSWVGKSKNSSISISVLREKLKNKYKNSHYCDRMVRIRKGEGIPITIVQ